MAKFILSAFADEYSPDFTEQCKGMNSLGIGYIEIRGVDGKNISDLNGEELKEAKSKLDFYGLKINSIGSPLGKIKVDGDIKAHYDLTKKICETALFLGTDKIRMFSFYPEDGGNVNDSREKIFEYLEKMIEIADGYNVYLCHENEADIYGETKENCLDLFNHFGSRLKCVFDMGNFTYTDHDAKDAYLALKDRIEYFHIKDGMPGRVFVPAGEGMSYTKEILSDYIKTADHDTFLTLEPHLHAFTGLSNLAHTQFKSVLHFNDNKESFTYAKKALDGILSSI